MTDIAYDVVASAIVPATAGCNSISWSPEVISLYGDSETILDKLSKFDLGLDDRRVFILTVETNDKSSD